MELEKWMAERLLERSAVEKTEERIGLLTRLFQSAREGDLCLEIERPPMLDSLCSERGPLVFEQGRLYLHKNWALETGVIERVRGLRAQKPVPIDSGLFFAALENIALQDEQRKAIEAALPLSLALFTGGPGTGKTYTAGQFIRALAKGKEGVLRVAVAAPTGKAAAHLEAALHAQGAVPTNLQLTSATLHRLLRISPGRHRFESDRFIDADLVVVDEASMLDVALLLQLLNGIGPATRLLLLGDPDQLPPVEAGSLFPELAELFGLSLRHSRRMGEGDLFSFAQAVNQGDRERVARLLEKEGDIVLLERDFSIAGREALVDWLALQVPSPLHSVEPDPLVLLESHKKFRVLSGLRQGLLGIDELNRLLHEKFSASFERWIATPILICKNEPRQQLYNGSSGVLVRRKGERLGVAYFSMPEGLVRISEGALPPYELGYCLSVHKSQGSEFDEVLVLIPPGSERFGREALYTAVTRAKKKVVLAIHSETFEKTLTLRARRTSGLKVRFLV